ncbi:MAG: molybdenum cofactor biosynthesis protein MoaE [Gammaproteobacteria bacterium]|nr:molybdenum cofactor biosynthesis protein MoaE [Gammaproteobacteria bacterium]
MIIQIQQADFNVTEVNQKLLDGRRDVGAITNFIGLVRDLPGADLKSMTLEHYPGMTEKSLQAIVAKAQQRWDILDCAVIHRVGELKPTDQIVLVSVLSVHREAAFSACEFIMDYLKGDAPFWKKETSAQNSAWVDAKNSDYLAKKRW